MAASNLSHLAFTLTLTLTLTPSLFNQPKKHLPPDLAAVHIHVHTNLF
jgi:hypothetical protein